MAQSCENTIRIYANTENLEALVSVIIYELVFYLSSDDIPKNTHQERLSYLKEYHDFEINYYNNECFIYMSTTNFPPYSFFYSDHSKSAIKKIQKDACIILEYHEPVMFNCGKIIFKNGDIKKIHNYGKECKECRSWE